MLIKRRKRRVPGLNATSTADISFILLVFFLVISSMDSNKGISKYLPPSDSEDTEQRVTELDRRNVMDIVIGTEGKILVDGKPLAVDRLKERIVWFVKNCPHRAVHVVNISMQPDTKYDDYFHVQDAVARAYATLRNTCARSRFHKRYADCTDEERSVVDKAFPQRVMENIEGKEVKGD